MVSFLNIDNIHCDSVKGHSPLSSNSIQIVPVQPSNFDTLQKGALMGAHRLIEQNKSIYYQYIRIKIRSMQGTPF